MKRAPFLTAAAAAILAGCGGRRGADVLPGGTAGSTQSQSRTTAASAAESIPASVLDAPILGEGRRFSGTVAPRGWVITHGQTLNIADNGPLLKILGTHGGDGKTTFTMPVGTGGWIIAVTGTAPTSPKVFSAVGREPTLQQSLGSPTAHSAIAPMKPLSPELLSQRRLITSSIAAGGGRFAPISAALRSRIEQSDASARGQMLASLTPGNRARLGDALTAAADGRSTVIAAVQLTASGLSDAEASALLRISDAWNGDFRSGWSGMTHDNATLEAARFAVSVGFTAAQLASPALAESA